MSRWPEGSLCTGTLLLPAGRWVLIVLVLHRSLILLCPWWNYLAITDSCVCLFKEVYALLGPDIQIPLYIHFFFFTLGGSPMTDAQIWIFSMLVSLVSTIFEVGFGKFSLSAKDFFTWTEADIWPFCWFSSMVELPLWDQNNLEMISLLGYWRVRILTVLKLSSIWF